MLFGIREDSTPKPGDKGNFFFFKILYYWPIRLKPD